VATRRPFNDLSPAYQGRLIRSGISPEQYQSGASLKAARGHAQTPERPSQALRAPHEYTSYFNRSIARGKEVPSDIRESIRISNAPLPERQVSDAIGYPGKRSLSTAIFTLSKGYSGSDFAGSITFISYSGNGNIVESRTIPYRMSEFKTLIRLAKDRGYVTQVVSTPQGW
jgi:hypothetical protein